MVCLGNICRSPLAQGIAEKIALENGLDWQVDSAGTSSWHIGEKPDSRSIKTAKQYGIDISYQRARQLIKSDLDDFDLILTMDSSNYNDVLFLSSNKNQENKVELILNYLHPGQNRAVPDPYYDGSFDRVYRLLNEALEIIAKSAKK